MKNCWKVMLLAIVLAKSQAVPLEQEKTETIIKTKSLVTERVEEDPELTGEYFEGDMDFDVTRNGVLGSLRRWPNAVVRYKLGPAFDVDHVLYILKAMEIIESKTCIRFYPASRATKAFIQINGADTGCNAKVGYTGRKQIVNLQVFKLDKGCFRIGSILHELLHALGFYHQHSTPQRDKFIKVLWGNIARGKEPHFEKFDSETVTNFGVKYDYNSVMHYAATSFSRNGGDTLVPLKGGENVEIGQRLYLSDGDVEKLNLMYDCE